MWIKRDLSGLLDQHPNFIQMLMGPRQCGKTSLLRQLDPEMVELSMDDLRLRTLAIESPDFLLSQYPNRKILIDEAQLAPPLFSALKQLVDQFKKAQLPRKVVFQLTGSNQWQLDQQVKESLAGRASYFELNTLSAKEVFSVPSLCQSHSLLDYLYQGGWPELYRDPTINTKLYLDDYLRSYVERDIVMSLGIHKQQEFLKFLQLLALRTGKEFNQLQMANDLRLSQGTIQHWISVLERMKLIALVKPYSSNLSSRLIKRPKIYFMDTGLACRLLGFSSSSQLLGHNLLGQLFETAVFSEIYKTISNYHLDWECYHWRSRDGEEVDFLLEHRLGRRYFLEVKVTAKTNYLTQMPRVQGPEVIKVFKDKVPPLLYCFMEQIPEGLSIGGENSTMHKHYFNLKELGQWLLQKNAEIL